MSNNLGSSTLAALDAAKCSRTRARSRESVRSGGQAEGFKLVSVRGSHHKFGRGPITVIVPHPKKDLPLGTARTIERQVGWT